VLWAGAEPSPQITVSDSTWLESASTSLGEGGIGQS
jgi:hypothetical protein